MSSKELAQKLVASKTALAFAPISLKQYANLLIKKRIINKKGYPQQGSLILLILTRLEAAEEV